MLVWCWDECRAYDAVLNKERLIDPGHVAIQVTDRICAFFPYNPVELGVKEVERGKVSEETPSEVAVYYLDLFISKGQRRRLDILALNKQVWLQEGVLASKTIKLPSTIVCSLPATEQQISGLQKHLSRLAELSRQPVPHEDVQDYDLRNFNCASFVNRLLVEFCILETPIKLKYQVPRFFREGLVSRIRELSQGNDVREIIQSKIIGVEHGMYVWVNA